MIADTWGHGVMRWHACTSRALQRSGGFLSSLIYAKSKAAELVMQTPRLGLTKARTLEVREDGCESSTPAGCAASTTGI